MYKRQVPNYVVGFVYGALVESFSCEQNARMMAMQSASNSARDMLAAVSYTHLDVYKRQTYSCFTLSGFRGGVRLRECVACSNLINHKMCIRDRS